LSTSHPRTSTCGSARLIAASMPSGVEHDLERTVSFEVLRLIAASMPSGVEHHARMEGWRPSDL